MEVSILIASTEKRACGGRVTNEVLQAPRYQKGKDGINRPIFPIFPDESPIEGAKRIYGNGAKVWMLDGEYDGEEFVYLWSTAARKKYRVTIDEPMEFMPFYRFCCTIDSSTDMNLFPAEFDVEIATTKNQYDLAKAAGKILIGFAYNRDERECYPVLSK